MTPLFQQRCLHHLSREAACRCPVCRSYFCRECVTEHDDRLVCAGCLKKMHAPSERGSRDDPLGSTVGRPAARMGVLFCTGLGSDESLMSPMIQRPKSALDLCEEAVHLLRSAPVAVVATYYLGSVPFVLGLLFFWADMSSSATAREHAIWSAFGLTLLYLWMLTWQSVFAQGLRTAVAGGDTVGVNWGEWRRIAAFQTAVQPMKLVALPVAAGLLIPFPEVYAFFHNASLSDSKASALRLARLWTRQNLTFLAILALMSIVVFINTGMAIMMLPYLAKMLLGIDTVFTRSPYTFLNTTFLAIVSGLSYLILNPFVKAFYVLRCFYGESLTTAEDLRVELKASGAAMMCAVALLGAGLAQAQPQDLADKLDQSINRVLKNPEYAWRLPRTLHLEERNSNWFVRNTIYFLQATDRGLKQVGGWIDQLAAWLGDRLSESASRLCRRNRAPALQQRSCVS